MTEDWKSSKKPRATFGDVMLGIPAGRGGQKEERREDRPRRDRRPRSDGPGAGAGAAEAGKERASVAADAPRGRDERRRRDEKRPERGPKQERPRREEKKPSGPMVVVKRATGVIETRALDEPRPEVAAEQEADAPAEAAPAQVPEPREAAESPAASVEAVEEPAPVTPRSSVAEEVHESQSFAEMFEESAKHDGLPGRRHFRVGEKVTGSIFQLGADTAFVSLGGKSEAMIELKELKDEEGILRFGVGDVVEAFITEAGAKGIILSRQLGKGAATLGRMADARLSGMPVEGMVLAVNKGGLEVAVGDVRAFCPAGQVDIRFHGKLDEFVGQRLQFRVMEVRDRNVVLSRRALLEEEQKALAAETRKGLAEGKVLKGKVTGVRDFGVFVDLGGVEGMVPVSELSHVRVGHPSEVVKVGEELEVEVLRLEPGNPNSPDKAKQKERITLSLRARLEDPWKAALAEIQEGARLKGKVVRLQPFGAFVELRPGVDGLIHISALSSRRIAHPRDAVKVGDEVEVQVEKVDPNEKRIGLRLVAEGEVVGNATEELKKAVEQTPGEKPRVGMVVEATVDRVESFGVFVLFPGGRGLIPGAETGTDRGSDLKRAFSDGQKLKAEIVDIDRSGKIKLSLVAAVRSEERKEIDAWKKSQPKGGGGKGFGTLADLLKNVSLTPKQE